MTILSIVLLRRNEIKIVDKRPSAPEPLLVKDCELGDVVTVNACRGSYYLVAFIHGRKYGINLERGGHVDEQAAVGHKVCVEAHVTRVEPV